MPNFRGFTTIGRNRAPYTINDSELIKRDLLNEFYTKLGERVMRPNFGSIIWDLLMDPSTAELDQLIKDDVAKIIDRDPRVRELKTVVVVLDQTIRVEIDLLFVYLESTDKLYLEYQRKITEGID